MPWSAQINGEAPDVEAHESVIEKLKDFLATLVDDVQVIEARFSGQHHTEVNLLPTADVPPEENQAAPEAGGPGVESNPPLEGGGSTSPGTAGETAVGGGTTSGAEAVAPGRPRSDQPGVDEGPSV